MPDEPQDLTLRLLREIRAKLDEHDKRFDRHDRRFDVLDKRLDEVRQGMTYALGIATHGNIRHDVVQGKLEDIEARLSRLEERV